MEVFIRDAPEQLSENGFRKQLQPYLDKISIQTYHCKKQLQKSFALVTFLTHDDGQRFLATYGQPKPPAGSTTSPKIRLLGTPIYCSVSYKQVNVHLLRSLAKEEKDRKSFSKKPATLVKSKTSTAKEFGCSSVSCGIWTYENSELCFLRYSKLSSSGTAKFGTRSLILNLGSGKRVDFLYSSIKTITTEDSPKPSITVTLWEAPRIYDTSDLIQMFARLEMNGQNNSQRRRAVSLGEDHDDIVGSCFVYRISLTGESKSLRIPLQNLQRLPGIPSTIHQQIDTRRSATSFRNAQMKLTARLSDHKAIPWRIGYQLRRLSTNGSLTPTQTLRLIPSVQQVMARSGVSVAAAAVRKLYSQIPYPGLDVEAKDFDLDAIVSILKSNEDLANKEEMVDSRDESLRGLAMIHRAVVTPSGIYLYGPDPEPFNRVLRKYASHHEFLLRVQFADEDGEPVRYNPRVSNEAIFDGRFKGILKKGFDIAGRRFDFLGFSHSSLRAQSCWFMSPFSQDGSLIYDRVLIQQLGDFTKIHCPAKCAARIGQAFSETPTAVPLPAGVVKMIADVERGPRVFSDGVGTISKSVMWKIWDAIPEMQKLKPTCFQIRYQGAKGMLSLDSRLQGDQVLMRTSMVKFEGSSSLDLELCGASYRPLPMYLNRQTIKIMEDIGVPDSFFLDLQSQEIERLRKVTTSASNAAKFLTSHSIGDRVHLSWFIRKLAALGLEFRSDRFLCDILELSVLMEVKTLKHRARYPVSMGLTLYGIMDETGILEENQIFCTFQSEAGKKKIVTKKNVVVTRSPALHPGDIQLVDAVDVPRDSPLMQLSNCICFSQKGDRDLPSKLSGGDLDGDLYNIVWDAACSPTKCFAPADYPRQQAVDIGRTVTRDDMTDFFVKFMETDQLGRIATTHQVLADQETLGTLDPKCVLLAEMHSTAVDFSKTGVPVDMKRMPKFSPARPDFMAMGNQVKMEKKDGLLLEAASLSTQDENNDDDDFQAYRYYESDKILGKLYRAIDEHEVFSDIRKYRQLPGAASSILSKVWDHVIRKCWNVKWAHHITWAREIREMYEDNLYNTMSSYSEHPSRPISELEAFIGNILGATGNQSKKQRDLSVTMKEAFDRDAGFVVGCMVNDDDGEHADEALERSMACLAESLDGTSGVGGGRNSDVLVSFGYIAAAVCLREIEAEFS
ncbi:hypothetical protein ACEPPN_013275 [Leptodophora sp. 'Broadleaf-Isolate-01']